MNYLWNSTFSPLKRIYKFVLKRLIGQFLASDLSLNQLDVALTSGTVDLINLDLNVEMLNSLCSSLPLRVVSGSISRVHLEIPVRNLFSSPCSITVSGLSITLMPSVHLSSAMTSVSASSILNAVKAEMQSLDRQELLQHVRLHQQLSKASVSKKSKHGNDNPDNIDPMDDDIDIANRADDTDADPRAVGEQSDDISSSGLKMVASFLERLISRTEVNMQDVHIKIENPHRDGLTSTLLAIHIPTIVYSDMSPATDEIKTAEKSSTTAGPVFAYDKEIRFRGFRVDINELATQQSLLAASYTSIASDVTNMSVPSKPTTIAIGDVDVDCVIELKINLVDTSLATAAAPKVTSRCFIRSLRTLLTPHHLSLLIELGQSLAGSSVIQARQVQQQQQMIEMRAEMERNERAKLVSDRLPVTPTKKGTEGQYQFQYPYQQHMSLDTSVAQPLQGSDYVVIEGLLTEQEHTHYHLKRLPALPSTAHTQNGQQFYPVANHEEDDETKSAGSACKPTPSLTDPALSASSVDLWSLSLHLESAILALLEEDEQLKQEWWLELPILATKTQTPATLLAPMIKGISVDHLLFSLTGVYLDLSQNSSQSVNNVKITGLKVEEYLSQMRLMVATMPSIRKQIDGSDEIYYEQKQQRMGFRARSLIQFEDQEDQPHLQCQVSAAVVGTLDPSTMTSSGPFILPSSISTERVSTRIHIHFQPVAIDLDLGLMLDLATSTSSQCFLSNDSTRNPLNAVWSIA